MLPVAWAFKEKVPFAAEATPDVAPSTMMVAPGSAPPVDASVTLPVICAIDTEVNAQQMPNRANRNTWVMFNWVEGLVYEGEIPLFSAICNPPRHVRSM